MITLSVTQCHVDGAQRAWATCEQSWAFCSLDGDRIAMRKRISASHQLGERPLILASLLESQSSTPGPNTTYSHLHWHSSMGSLVIRSANLVEKILLVEATVDFGRPEKYMDHLRERDRQSDRS